MKSYQAFAFGMEFPIRKQKKAHSDDDEEEKKSGLDPNAINAKLSELVRMVHGSFEPKPKICDDFNEKNPECSKNSIERKLKEYFVKDKRGEDPRQRYYANEEIVSRSGIDVAELNAIASERLEPLLAEIKAAQLEIDEAN